jgi:hypothetical protein
VSRRVFDAHEVDAAGDEERSEAVAEVMPSGAGEFVPPGHR